MTNEELIDIDVSERVALIDNSIMIIERELGYIKIQLNKLIELATIREDEE